MLVGFSVEALADRRALLLSKRSEGAAGSPTFPAGAVAYWKMDEASGARADSTGNGHSLADAGFEPESRSGVINLGGDFGGPSEFEWLEVADHADVSIAANEDFTFSFWINSDSIASFVYVLAKDSVNQEWNVYVDTAGKINFNWWNAAGVVQGPITTTGAISTGQNKHIVITYDQSNIKIYIDGSLDTTSPNTEDPRDSTSDFEVGRSEGAGGGYFDGLIDEIGIWKRALSLSEVGDLYNGGSGLQP